MFFENRVRLRRPGRQGAGRHGHAICFPPAWRPWGPSTRYPIESSLLVRVRPTIRGESIESSLLAAGDDPRGVFQTFLGTVGPIEIQMSESHLAFGSFECTETFRDTLMATPDAQIPDPRRVTYNGDLLAVGH